ncbi:hypothetical protein BH24ACI4_BH24ACI4_11420 [soil metagenome]
MPRSSTSASPRWATTYTTRLRATGVWLSSVLEYPGLLVQFSLRPTPLPGFEHLRTNRVPLPGYGRVARDELHAERSVGEWPKVDDFPRPEPTIPDSPGHTREFLEASGDGIWRRHATCGRPDPRIRVREELAKPAHPHPADADHPQHNLIVRALTRNDPSHRGENAPAARSRPGGVATVPCGHSHPTRQATVPRSMVRVAAVNASAWEKPVVRAVSHAERSGSRGAEGLSNK